MENFWSDVHSGLELSARNLLAELKEGLGRLETVHRQLESPAGFVLEEVQSLTSLKTDWTWLQQKHLKDPLGAIEAPPMLAQVVESFRRFAQELDDLARSSPRLLRLSGPDFCTVLGESAGGKPWLLRFSKTERALFARAVLVRESHRGLPRFFRLAGEFLEHLCQGVASLLSRWRFISTHWCRELLDGIGPAGKMPGWNPSAAQRSLAKLDRFCQDLPRIWSRALLAAVGKSVNQLPPRDATPHPGEGWAGLLVQVQSKAAVHSALGQAMVAHLELFQELEVSLRDEHSSLQGELEDLNAWVGGFDGLTLAPEPPPEAQITPASNRMPQFQEKIKVHLSRLETPANLQASALLEAPRVERLLSLVENDHRRLLQALEQAREVIRHARQEHGSEQEQILTQAVANVKALLQHWGRFEPEWGRQIVTSAARTCAAFYLDAENGCQTSWSKNLSYYWTRFFRGARERGDGLGPVLLQLSRQARERIAGWTRYFLNRIGWSAAQGGGYQTVVRRPGLTSLVNSTRPSVEIPAIYRRLFRMEAVSDARFLIGRERELAALDEAYRFWRENRPISVLVTGHRGSGKTSLINCAFHQLPEDVQMVRGDFGQRCMQVEHLEQRLCEILGLEPGANLSQALADSQRLIILEEVERTFLRKVGGYEAARHLLRLIASSSQTTLWVLVMNRVSYELLQAALAFGDPFSHRIDTAAVPAEVLQKAVLSRHNLSGLRLNLPKPARARWWKWQLDCEKEYFKAFAARTDGVFRTAFEVWQDQIAKVQAGVLFMAPLEKRGLTQVVEELELQDLFLLVAILQHGSLEPGELAEIFSLSPQVCRAQLDQLASRELIAADPRYPGLRIRPEAGPVVRAVLYQKNMI